MTAPQHDPLAATVWGDLYEIAVKRGCLGYLASAGLLPEGAPPAVWADTPLETLHEHLYQQLDILDRSERARHSSTLDHFLLTGWALGWTVLREAITRTSASTKRVRGVHCPLTLRDRRQGAATLEHQDAVAAFWAAMPLDGPPDGGWNGRGEPAHADFFLWLTDGEQDHLFALEFSLNAPLHAENFAESPPHLREVLAFARRLESRGVFTRIGATLTGEEFAFSRRLITHLPAFTSKDKPLYKLCQASSYVTRFAYLMQRRGTPLPPATAHAFAITSGGVEALQADATRPRHPRWQLMSALGAAYRAADKLDDDSPAALNRQIAAVQAQLVQALPVAFREPVATALADSAPDTGLAMRLKEQVAHVVNPATRVDCHALLTGVDESDDVQALLATEQPRATLAAMAAAPDGTATLRDVHAAALKRALACAPRGQITVLAAEGMPGIGKTAAIMDGLTELSGGFLWLYASPRLVINSVVTARMARTDSSEPSGVLTLTSNARLISGAAEWWRRNHPGDRAYVDGAVAFDGWADLRRPRGSTILVTPAQAAEIEGRHGGGGLRKRTLDEHNDALRRDAVPGVLATLADTARSVLERNDACDRIVLTASIQGFRQLLQANTAASARTTVERLSKLFRYRADTPEGTAERRRFGQRIPTIVVMVDEIAGDGAGAPFVHALSEWLQRQFVAPFDLTLTLTKPGDNPFRVVLVLADASLGNAAVMERYLEHQLEAPEKVIVSPSKGAQPFRVEAGALHLGGYRLPALHVMADGFPARALEIDYRLHLTPVRREAGMDALGASAIGVIRQQEGQHTLVRAVQTIFDALGSLADSQQVIFFAQDKILLRTIKHALVDQTALAEHGAAIDTHDVSLVPDDVAVLDSSILAAERSALIRAAVRDRKRVFLMTSSGSRGVSFPLATTIIAMVPTFAVESGFMEIAQLVYRGRGRTQDPRSGAEVDGDTFDRRLVLLLQDFVVADEDIDERYWLRRTIDVLSALVLLRATLLTRMTGDAGIPGQRAAIVPVGRIGTDDVTGSLSQVVAAFLREAAVSVRDHLAPEDVGLIQNALTGVTRFFENLHREASLAHGQHSLVQEATLRSIVARVTARQAPLFDAAGSVQLPENAYAVGPVWLETWAGVPSDERFFIQALTGTDLRDLELLRRQLGVVGAAWDRFPVALTSAARDLYRILDRTEALRSRSFSAGQRSESTRQWICLPMDYTSFCYVEGEHGRELRPPHVDEHPLWRDGMLRIVAASATPTSAEPVIATYAEHPFVVVQTTGDPTGLSRAFDERYFMASTELNLLNTLLFVDGAE